MHEFCYTLRWAILLLLIAYLIHGFMTGWTGGL